MVLPTCADVSSWGGTPVARGRRMRLARSLPFLVLAACVTGESAPDESSLEQDIVGGTQASTTEFSVVVGLLHGNNNWFCTGVLVDKDWVLTAASCFDNTNATQIRL